MRKWAADIWMAWGLTLLNRGEAFAPVRVALVYPVMIDRQPSVYFS